MMVANAKIVGQCSGKREDGGRRGNRQCEGGGRSDIAEELRTAASAASAAAEAVGLFAEDQMFEEDVRAVVAMMRPHRRERLMGWAEYRTGGSNFRATISWDRSFEHGPQSVDEQCLSVPRLTDVLESILVGSVKDHDALTPAEEFDIYRGIVRELYRRLDEMQSRYE